MRRQLTWTQVAREIGVASSTLQRVESGGRMEADGVRAMVRWLGVPPERFVVGGSIEGSSVSAANRRFDTTALYAALDAKRKRDGMTWSEVAPALGVPASAAMLTRLRRRGRIEVNLMVAATAWAGVPIESLTYSSPS